MTSETSSSEFLTIPEVAGRLRISHMSVRRMIVRGELAGVQIGRQWRIPAKAMTTMLSTIQSSLETQFRQAKDKAEQNKLKAEGRTQLRADGRRKPVQDLPTLEPALSDSQAAEPALPLADAAQALDTAAVGVASEPDLLQENVTSELDLSQENAISVSISL